MTAVRAREPVDDISDFPYLDGVIKSADVNEESFDFGSPLLKRLMFTYRWFEEGRAGEPIASENLI